MKHRPGPKHASNAGLGLFALPVPDFVRDDFLEMLSKSQKTVFKVCLFFSDRQPDSIRDLYQEIVRTLWEAWPNFRGESSTDTWVRRIAINVAVNEMRSIARQPQFVPLEEWMYVAISEEREIPSTDYYRIISALDPDERELVYLRLDKLSLHEIAEMLSISEDSVKQRYRRLRQKINAFKQKENED